MNRLEFSGWLAFFAMIASTIAVLFIFFLLPSMVATALWNAVVYETLGGPTIGIQQGFLLWAMVCVVLYGIFRPSIQVVFDETDLAALEEMDLKFRKKKNEALNATKKPKKQATPSNTKTTTRTPAEKEAAFFSVTGASPKEKTAVNTPSAHWLKWRKQQAEALQAAAEAKKLTTQVEQAIEKDVTTKK
jgi:hypothetical protein